MTDIDTTYLADVARDAADAAILRQLVMLQAAAPACANPNRPATWHIRRNANGYIVGLTQNFPRATTSHRAQ